MIEAHRRAELGARARRHAEAHLARDAILARFEHRLEALIAGEYAVREAVE